MTTDAISDVKQLERYSNAELKEMLLKEVTTGYNFNQFHHNDSRQNYTRLAEAFENISKYNSKNI
ncbi:hypothetical protein [Piscibacillus salipiscarius]|uniref:Uncharacterized protein n=1 Tax=Piscibacillus salipiscarius TaxID=299480 RepID=A0ABW5Q797_9BACI|nr:hypothetical protein [Piscibacillus salipiscarius]